MFVWLDDVHNIAEGLTLISEGRSKTLTSFDRYSSLLQFFLPDPTLKERKVFVAQRSLTRPYASIVVIKDLRQESSQQLAAEALKNSLIIRATANNPEYPLPDPERMEESLMHGVHIISTDYEMCGDEMKEYEEGLGLTSYDENIEGKGYPIGPCG